MKCILRWAAHREKPTCPQCKAPFDTVSTYLQLDGTLCDFPCEESVVLLLRARWFTDHMQVCPFCCLGAFRSLTASTPSFCTRWTLSHLLTRPG